MAPPPPTAPKPDDESGSEKSRPASPEVPGPLRNVQETLLNLEYGLRSLAAVAADVQPPGPNDPPQGRIADKV